MSQIKFQNFVKVPIKNEKENMKPQLQSIKSENTRTASLMLF